nr:hypothetical protein [Photorhabdus heterorhabditis]
MAGIWSSIIINKLGSLPTIAIISNFYVSWLIITIARGTVTIVSAVLNITESAAFSGWTFRLFAIIAILSAIGVDSMKVITTNTSWGVLAM